MLPLITGATALAAAAIAGYHSMAPRSQLFGRTFIGTPGHGRKLALTYDDGPNDAQTMALLEVLARHKVKATFFLIGKYVLSGSETVKRIHAEGHEIGNHTFSHPVSAFRNRDQMREELRRCSDSLGDAGVPESMLFRPPFGARRPATLRLARELGYTPVMWSVTCYDWKKTTADRVEAHAVRGITGGDVILLHDGGHKRMGADRSHTIAATERIIRRYQEQGFEFGTITEMIKSSP